MGGNSGGGGGGAGIVDYPAHIKTFHENVLGDGLATAGVDDMDDVMAAALGGSPYAAATPYDPDADITAYEAAIAGFVALIGGITETTDWDALYTQAVASIMVGDTAVVDVAVVDKAIVGITDAEILLDTAAFGASLDDQIITVVLPRFQAGMRDINAVVSSAFVVGQSNIEGFRDRDVAKHESGLRVEATKVNVNVDVEEAKMNLNKDVVIESANLNKDVTVETSNMKKDVSVAQLRVSASDQMLRLLLNSYAWQEAYMKVVVEGKRIKIVAKKEETDLGYEYDEKDAVWDLEVFSYGGNLLASIGGGVLNPKKPSTGQSMIGGALSGAAAGAMVGGPPGAIIGGILGAASSFL